MIVAYNETMYPLTASKEEFPLFTPEKSKNNWHSDPFIKWWETKQEKFRCGQFNEKEVAYSAWLAAIEYYIDNIEEKPLPYLSPTEKAAGLTRTEKDSKITVV
jgi:hypothetical protein